MEITQISLNGLDLRTWPYLFYIGGFDDISKEIVTNDLLINGQAWGRAKVDEKTLTINGYIRSSDNKYRVALNKSVAPNGLKPLLLSFSDGSQRVGYVEIKSKAAADQKPRKISMTAVMPDPCWYAIESTSVALGATYGAAKTYPYTTTLSPGLWGRHGR